MAVACRAQTQGTTAAWAWFNGDSTSNGSTIAGTYGMLGVASRLNTPSSRVTPSTWTDSAGNFWLFGGFVGDNDPNATLELNDLWKFDPLTAEWTWIGGASSGVPVPGKYGQLGVASPDNMPGSRDGSVTWTDKMGNLWLFGGYGYDSAGADFYLNDLWKFDPISTEWTWMGGSSTLPIAGSHDLCAPFSYGTPGVASISNQPGGRYLGGAWTDASGTFWLFGGVGCANYGLGGPLFDLGNLNDLWTYSPATGQWTWIGGTNGTDGTAAGNYGTLGLESSTSFPGSRYAFAQWTDTDGRFWLFGGIGLDAIGKNGYLNDLWRFDPVSRQWAWISGSDTIGPENCQVLPVQGLFGCAQAGVYGTLGQPAAGNVPGGRDFPVGVNAGDGTFLLFGGAAPAESGTQTTETSDLLNDLWRYDPATSEWAWISGSDAPVCGDVFPGTDVCKDSGERGTYGTNAMPAKANVPGGRGAGVSWIDKAGNFWIFGGNGFDSQACCTDLNDTWGYGTSLPVVAPVPTASAVTVTSSARPAFTQNTVTFTAHVSNAATPTNVPTGSVVLSESAAMAGPSTALGSATVDASGNATFSVASLPVGTYSITATYNGDVNNLSSIGSTIQLVGDFSIAANPPASATVANGGAATFNLMLTPVGPIRLFPAAIALTASGGPAGATYTFAPASLASGSLAANVVLTVTAPATSVAGGIQWPFAPASSLLLAGVIVPFFRWSKRCRRARLMGGGWPAVLLLLVGGLGAVLALGGCGNSFYTRAPAPGSPIPPTSPAPQSYTITVTGVSGGLNHSETVTLVVD